MGTITVEERQARIAQDDGDPDDEVVLLTNTQSTTPSVYHENRNCPSFRVDSVRRTLTREEAQRAFKAPCKRCVLRDVDRGGDYANDRYYRALLNHSGEDLDLDGDNSDT